VASGVTLLVVSGGAEGGLVLWAELTLAKVRQQTKTPAIVARPP